MKRKESEILIASVSTSDLLPSSHLFICVYFAREFKTRLFYDYTFLGGIYEIETRLRSGMIMFIKAQLTMMMMIVLVVTMRMMMMG